MSERMYESFAAVDAPPPIPPVVNALPDSAMQEKRYDEQVLNKFIEENRENILRYIFTKVRNQADAEDITQQVFIRYSRYFREGKIQSNHKAYLFFIARSEVINYFKIPLIDREQNKLPVDGVIIDETVDKDGFIGDFRGDDRIAPVFPHQVEDPEWIWGFLENDNRFQRAFAQLSPKVRKVFAAHLKGMSNQEIGDAYHLSSPTVANRISRAQKLLRDWYNNASNK